MKKLLIAVLASIVAFTLPATGAIAAVSSANVALTSNYVFRGQTQTDDGAALQGSYDIKQSKEDIGWYAGAFASNVDIGGNSGLEVDLYGGWRDSFGNQSSLGYDVGAVIYEYTDSKIKGVREVYAGINYETAYLKLYMGNGSGINSYNYLDVGASFVVLQDIDLNLHAGRYLSSPSSNDVSASLSMDVKGYDLSLGATYEDAGIKNDFEFFVTIGKEFDF